MVLRSGTHSLHKFFTLISRFDNLDTINTHKILPLDGLHHSITFSVELIQYKYVSHYNKNKSVQIPFTVSLNPKI